MKWLNHNSSSAADSDINLPLTPMADVLIVVLIFLLKGLSMNIDVLGLKSDIHLPDAHGGPRSPAPLRIGIGPQNIELGDHVVLAWKNFGDETQVDNENLEKALIQAGFVESLKPQLAHIEVNADRSAPFAVVRSVLSLASGAGATNIKLGVIGR